MTSTYGEITCSQCDMFQNGNGVSESRFGHICQRIIKDRVNRNCRKEPYLAESMYKFIVVQEIKMEFPK